MHLSWDVLKHISRNILIPTWEELEYKGLGLKNDSVHQIHEWVLSNNATPLVDVFAQITKSWAGSMF